jgi:RHS repeat-associated protein
MRKRLLFVVSILWVALQVTVAQSTNQNYIKTTTYLNEAGTASLSAIQYYDGLGRPVQTVQAGVTPNHHDLVTYQEYDGFGRDSTAWLPRVKQNNQGAFVSLSTFKSLSTTIYQNDTKPYSLPVYEPSPLNRVVKQFGPGQNWHSGNGHPVTTDYKTNNTTDLLYKCILFSVSGENLVKNNYYAANQLYVTETKDEDGKVSYQFVDKLGRVVMTRQRLQINVNTVSCVDTYYVYDDFGNLRFVLPPLAADGLSSGSSWTETNDVLKKFAYLYRYDERNRCTAKRLPGCDWQYRVYDKADRLILSQDGNQRIHTPEQWTFNKYDELGRVIITGVYDTNQGQASLVQKCKNIVVSEQYNGGLYGYSWSVLPEIPYTGTLMVYYYDDYDRMEQHGGIPTDLRYAGKSGYGTRYINTGLGSKSAKGLLIGTRAMMLEESGEIMTTMYYDNRGQIIQTRATNLLGGFDMTYNVYDFTGNVTKTLTEHTISQNSPVNECYEYAYDHAGRLLSTTYTLNDNTSVVLAENTYDELGRLIEKKRHDGADSEEYEYNICNWATKITSGDFVENLYYNTNLPSNSDPYYNGNISAITWTYNGQTNGYMYYYDGLNRMTGNYSTLNGVFKVDYEYSENFGYDKHGNITAVSRWGEDPVDQLSLTYNGNQVKKVTDSGFSQYLYDRKEYYDLANDATEFFYDSNGNLTADLDRKIVAIRYNVLNLPDTVQFASGNQILHRYDATGRKLRTEYITALNAEMVELSHTMNTQGDDFTHHGTVYNGNKEYRSINTGYSELSRVHNPEGYVEYNTPDDGFEGDIQELNHYNYYRRDHLGNVREVWSAPYYTAKDYGYVQNHAAYTRQRTQYYPGGLPWKSNTGDNPSVQPYKYNGKEFIETHGYDTYDYGARGLHAAKMRFETMDPLAEKYYSVSPYAYCLNNPVNAIDIEGQKVVFINGYLGFGSPNGGAAYWNSTFVQGSQTYFNDNTTPYFTDVEHGLLSTASWRHSKGYNYAKENYKSLIDGMKEGETFKLVSHSMGGAFSTGIQQYLEEQGWAVESSVFINTYQSSGVETKKNNSTFIIDYQTINDPVLRLFDGNSGYGKIKNANLKIREKSKKDISYRHRDPIDSGSDFWNNLKNTMDYQNRYMGQDVMNQINTWLQQNPDITVTYY